MDPYNFIKNAIIEGVYEPGQRLTEEFLADELSLSRTPIREAIKRLETEGLVCSLKRGISVRSFTRKDIKQIYDLRALLEGYAASQASIMRTDQDIQKLSEANNSFYKVINDISEVNSLDIQNIVSYNINFHEAILLSCKNEHLQHLVSKVVVVPMVYRSFYWYDKKDMMRSFEEHQTILNAIINRDTERAKTAMLEHIYKGTEHVLQFIK